MKNHTCYYFDYVIKIEDFDINIILIDEKTDCQFVTVHTRV